MTRVLPTLTLILATVQGSGYGDIVLSDGEGGRGLHGIPVLLRKWISALLEALLALGKTLVLANSHDCGVGVGSRVLSSFACEVSRNLCASVRYIG